MTINQIKITSDVIKYTLLLGISAALFCIPGMQIMTVITALIWLDFYLTIMMDEYFRSVGFKNLSLKEKIAEFILTTSIGGVAMFAVSAAVRTAESLAEYIVFGLSILKDNLSTKLVDNLNPQQKVHKIAHKNTRVFTPIHPLLRQMRRESQFKIQNTNSEPKTTQDADITVSPKLRTNRALTESTSKKVAAIDNDVATESVSTKIQNNVTASPSKPSENDSFVLTSANLDTLKSDESTNDSIQSTVQTSEPKHSASKLSTLKRKSTPMISKIDTKHTRIRLFAKDTTKMSDAMNSEISTAVAAKAG